MWQLLRSDYPKLIAVLGLAFYFGYLPHQGYPYPVHIDEWVHMAYAQAILRAGNTTFIDPFLGEGTVNLSSHLETGFQLFWAVFQRLSGLSWMTIFRYFPGIVFVMTALSAYVLGRREGFGWQAALLATLVPTTVGIMGPAFLVPVGMGLVFFPLALFLAFNFASRGSYLVLFALVAFLMAMHPPSAILLVMVLAPFLLLSIKGRFTHSLGLGLALALPFLAALPWIIPSGDVREVVRSVLVPKPLPVYHDLPRVIKIYGDLPLLLSLLGAFVLALKGSRKGFGLVLGLLTLLVMLATFYTFHYGVGIMYLRGLPVMMLMAGIVGGAALAGVQKLGLPALLLRTPWAAQLGRQIGNILCLALVIVTLTVTIPERQNTPYYHMINDEDYRAFVWIRDNVDSRYQKAILDPWKATAFVALTGRYVYTRTHVAPTPRDNQAREFLNSGGADTAFLRANGISVVYASGGWENPDLAEVSPGVYLLR